jgi:phosphoribosylaminoimidazolecarboxamide formyltransferase/IMP cyclohydrolase
MISPRKIKTALVSVYNKDGLSDLLAALDQNGVQFLSTGGTRQYIEELGYQCLAVEDFTGYPAILGGRVKTLHPKIFGGILNRRDNDKDKAQVKAFGIEPIDLVIVDLYPFEQTVADGGTPEEIIEKIDIGGISLIRAAAKNHNDVVIVPSRKHYGVLQAILDTQGAETDEEQRRWFAREAFATSSHYDAAIFNYFDGTFSEPSALRLSVDGHKALRYGENPHQMAMFYGNFDEMFTQLHGKDISYNNLLDIDAATALLAEFDAPTCAVIKHNNACGVATRATIAEAWRDALAGDPVSAFGGIIAANRRIDAATADEINKIFFEVIIAPAYDDDALAILQQKKNRIILVQHGANDATRTVRSALGGVLVQDRDNTTASRDDLKTVTVVAPTDSQIDDLLFAEKIVKHSKSNAIVLAHNGQLLGSGVGQTSRVDALRHAIEKARSFELDLTGAVMASDAFFPFGDCVEIADAAGVTAVIQPGGSVRDNESIEYCNAHGIAMVMTGIRHFRH